MQHTSRLVLLAVLLVAVLFSFGNWATASAKAVAVPSVTDVLSDAKFFNSGYIAHTGMESVARQALAVRTAAAFDASYLTQGSIAHALEAELVRAQAFRWQHMAATYADSGLLTDDPNALTAARWLAMADYYADHGLLTDDPDVALVARWQATADYYASHGLLLDNFDYAEADALMAERWKAMAHYYERLGLLNPAGDVIIAEVAGNR